MPAARRPAGPPVHEPSVRPAAPTSRGGWPCRRRRAPPVQSDQPGPTVPANRAARPGPDRDAGETGRHSPARARAAGPGGTARPGCAAGPRRTARPGEGRGAPRRAAGRRWSGSTRHPPDRRPRPGSPGRCAGGGAGCARPARRPRAQRRPCGSAWPVPEGMARPTRPVAHRWSPTRRRTRRSRPGDARYGRPGDRRGPARPDGGASRPGGAPPGPGGPRRGPPYGLRRGPVVARAAAGVARPAAPDEQTSGRGVPPTRTRSDPPARRRWLGRLRSYRRRGSLQEGARPGAGDGISGAATASPGPAETAECAPGARVAPVPTYGGSCASGAGCGWPSSPWSASCCLGAVPLFFGCETLSHDPVFDTLDALDVPAWATTKTVDNVSGSRWCLQDCRLRERVGRVTSRADEADRRGPTSRRWPRTAGAAGRSTVARRAVEGSYTCWRRDELTLDLWVRDPDLRAAAGRRGAGASAQTAAAARECTGRWCR